MTGPHLDEWIADLRDRLDRRDLAALTPVDLGYGTRQLPGGTTVRIMLADLTDLDDPARSWVGDDIGHASCRYQLLDGFRRLRALIG